MRRAALSSQPRVSLKNASTLITQGLMAFWRNGFAFHSGHNVGKVVTVETNEATEKAGHTHTNTLGASDSLSAKQFVLSGLGRRMCLTGNGNKLWLKNDGEPHLPIRTENISKIPKGLAASHGGSRHMWTPLTAKASAEASRAWSALLLAKNVD